MTCQLPPPLSDDEISAALDGTAEEGVIQHLTLCPDCADRASDARQLEAVLSRRLNRWDCPPAQTLGEYHLALLNNSVARQIAAHVAECVRCQNELADLAGYLAADAPAALEAAPDPRGLRQRFRPDAALGALLARRPALALRGAGEEPVIVEAGAVTLFLRVEPGAGQPALLGQMAGEDLDRWIGALVQLWQDGALRASAEVDDLATFRCEAFDLRPFELAITGRDGASILVPQIDLTD